MEFELIDNFIIELKDLKKMAYYYYYVEKMHFWPAVWDTFPAIYNIKKQSNLNDAILAYQIYIARNQIENIVLPKIFKEYSEKELKKL